MIVDGKELEIRMKGKIYHCALDITMDYIGGKWKTVVLWYLIKGPKRFSELRRQVPDITEKMLSLQLKDLEAHGIISRKVYPEVPPRVEYAFTEEGKTLIPALEEIAAWGRYMGKKYGKIQEVKKAPTQKKKTKV
jgi:DNA-binding HxlR family transcriptional regulator